MESHSFPNLMRYNSPATPTSPFSRTRLPPYAATYGELAPVAVSAAAAAAAAAAASWNTVSPPFDTTGRFFYFIGCLFFLIVVIPTPVIRLETCVGTNSCSGRWRNRLPSFFCSTFFFDRGKCVYFRYYTLNTISRKEEKK